MQEDAGPKLGRLALLRGSVRELLETRMRIRVVRSIDGSARTLVNRIMASAVRAFLVMILILMPSVILPGIGTDTRQMVALVALFAGALTFIEYNAEYPSLVEFRDGAPFNRIRYLMLLAIIVSLSMIAANDEASTTATRLFEAVGILIGHAMDFPYSPVRLATFMMGDDASPAQILDVRTAAGTAYFLSLLSLAFFVVILKSAGWPSTHNAFNVWVNLPTFEPTAGGDVIDRLERDARFNLALGFLLPFLIPSVLAIGTSGVSPLTLTSPQTLVWTISAWAFLPASLLMRGVAMGRIADMIRIKRDLNHTDDAPGPLLDREA